MASTLQAVAELQRTVAELVEATISTVCSAGAGRFDRRSLSLSKRPSRQCDPPVRMLRQAQHPVRHAVGA
ncbi:MAG: hypothetical protein LBS86_07670 [Treponema sp.]|nr:hypothetical protein [Treponema sp.]